MENLKINVYDENDVVTKTVEAKLVDIKFGVIRKLMAILNIDNVDNTFDIVKSVYDAWDEITEILTKVFPDLTVEEMDNVRLNELIPTLLTVIKYSFAQIVNIPSNEKN